MNEGIERVLDASCLLALLHDEPGGDAVVPLIDGAALSAVNWSEVVQKLVARDVRTDGMQTRFEAVGLRIVPFGVHDAEQAASLWHSTRSLGLSLADRACLCLGSRFEVPVFTADRTWTELRIDVEIRSIR